jgi:hypothetical protein
VVGARDSWGTGDTAVPVCRCMSARLPPSSDGDLGSGVDTGRGGLPAGRLARKLVFLLSCPEKIGQIKIYTKTLKYFLSSHSSIIFTSAGTGTGKVLILTVPLGGRRQV